MADNGEEAALPVVKFAFVQIVANLLGAEGPVIDTNGTFYMVAPEVEKNSLPAGQVVRVDLDRKEVCSKNGGRVSLTVCCSRAKPRGYIRKERNAKQMYVKSKGRKKISR